MRNSKLKHNLVEFGISRALRFLNKNPRVIFYHGVDFAENNHSLHINPDIFEQEIAFLSKHYEVISIHEYENRFRNNQFNGKEIVVTFDDGYKNNLTIAAPILKSLNIPFTVFISTNHIENGNYFPTTIARMIIRNNNLSFVKIDCLKLKAELKNNMQREAICDAVIHILKHSNIRLVNEICHQLIENISHDEYEELCHFHKIEAPMNWEDVIKLHTEYNCTIGSHCKDHFICNIYQTEEETKTQLKGSKQIIEEKLHASCDYLAYPNGIYNKGDVTAYAQHTAKEAGYKLAFTTVTDRLSAKSNPMLMPRCAARFEMDDFIMKLVLKPKIQF
ncbi:polysaccharide deacetylase family protein [Parabacteroides chinchillae]|uniref:Polysaccharide deacetylase n=1 Tax=Parabacteroides chinchillae TaxID=871327 RepID=A0A8G2BVI3_9BACT|nr:polysaccharide deacetylase family protein [Parabacteroides chinchillae]SEF72721.1 Polysaccharide deacetylase [Parabacteroides chinchillae]